MKNSETLRMVFGILILLILAALATAIALGKVEEKTSFGLPQIIGALTVLAGSWGQWAFSSPPRDKDKD